MRRFSGAAMAAVISLAISLGGLAGAANDGGVTTSPSVSPPRPAAPASSSSATPFPAIAPFSPPSPSVPAPPPSGPPNPLASPFPKQQASSITISFEGKTHLCGEQDAQPFLIRGNWFPKKPEDAKAGQQLLKQAIDYRTEKYGQFPGFGSPSQNPHPPKYYAESTSFLGLPIQLNKRIIPALKCVEAALTTTGLEKTYKPSGLSGIRFSNTYRGVEVSNHVYGIAIDIDPSRNSCCGCVAPWPNHPLCKKKGTPYDRMAMPRSWVEVFEKYGFYWLGHDALQDTMHFEFLGDPDKIFAN